MFVRLLQPHYITDRVWPVGTEMELPRWVRVTVFMQGLDPTAEEAVRKEKVRVFGRRLRRGQLLDDPPIERPDITNAQPVPRVGHGAPR